MKDKKSLEASAKAARKHIKDNLVWIGDLNKKLDHKAYQPDVMKELRQATEDLVQRVHEYSAYTNCLHTD